MTREKETTNLPVTAKVAAFPSAGNAIFPSTGKPVDLTKTLKAYIEKLAGATDLEAKNVGQAIAEARRARDMSSVGEVLLGYWLGRIYSMDGQDGFKTALEALRISKSAAYRAMDALRLFSRFDDLQCVMALAELGPTKALAFRNWSDTDLRALTAGKRVNEVTLDEVLELPAREVEVRAREAIARDEEMQALRKQTATLEAQLDTERVQRQRERDRYNHRLNRVELPEFAVVAREESAALTEEINLCLDRLDEVLAVHLVANIKVPESKKFQAQAAGTFYHSLRQVQARTQALLQQVEEHFGSEVTGQVRYEHQLKQPELETFASARDAILGRIKDDARDRAAARSNRPDPLTGKQRRGRPAGSTKPGKRR